MHIFFIILRGFRIWDKWKEPLKCLLIDFLRMVANFIRMNPVQKENPLSYVINFLFLISFSSQLPTIASCLVFIVILKFHIDITKCPTLL